MAPSERKLALVTGASGGIGLEIARKLVTQDYDVVLVARSSDKLKALATELEATGARAIMFAEDLTDASAPKRIRTALRRRKLSIDMLVNNAGVLELGAFQSVAVEKSLAMITLNNEALVRMTAQFLPDLLEKGEGHILNVASIAAFQPVPTLAVYGATKAFVLSYTEALSVELETHGINVTALCPGITDTGMMAGVTDDSGDDMYIPDIIVSDPVDVAALGVEAVLSGQVIAIPGAGNKLMIAASRYQPKWMVRRWASLVSKLTSAAKA